jgi:hypothetical protein
MNGTATTTGTELQGQRFFSILTNLRQDLTDMLKREMDLLKTELSEKMSCMGKQGVNVAIGGGVALIGVIFLLIGICGLIAFGLIKAGLDPMLAFGLAFLGFGLIMGIVGYLVLNKGIAALKTTSFAPAQTLRTVKEITKPDANPITAHATAGETESEKARKVKQARAAVERKIQDVQTEAAELRARMTPKYMWAATRTACSRRPQLTAGIGAAVVALGYLLMRRRHRTITIG